MSHTIHYCDATLDQITSAVAHLGGKLVEEEPILDCRVYRLTWHEPEEPDKLYGVDLWVHPAKKGGVSVDKGCVTCFNGQSELDEHLKRLGIESTYWD